MKFEEKENSEKGRQLRTNKIKFRKRDMITSPYFSTKKLEGVFLRFPAFLSPPSHQPTPQPRTTTMDQGSDSKYEAMPEDVLYSHNNVTITEKEGIRLGCYYFPTGNSKTIPWSDIKSVEERDLKWYNKKTWGMAIDCQVWWHYDRMMRECTSLKGIVIHLKEQTKVLPGLTVPTDRVDEVKKIIESHLAPQPE
eukprot:3697457-Rhodomonas_salina.2